jgi:isoleucyl-tRNA synthetase
MRDFKEIEDKIHDFWKTKKKEINRAVQDDTKKKIFSFLEGPPTANAPPGLHHLEVRTFKDIICKFRYMQGFSVPRKGGWDTHGLPVEVQVEKQLGLESKKDVIKYGVEKFIKKCRESVFSNIEDWNKSTEELGYWIDLKNPYITLDNDYIESVWWSLKELYNKKLLYEGHKVVPFCTRCGTPLSSHEVSQGYEEVRDESIYVAFKVKNSNEYILAWTTTPWTLPGNVALAVGKDIKYVRAELPDGDKLILAKDKLNLIRGEYKIIEEMKGLNLNGLEYEPLFEVKELKNENSHKIIIADFVTTEEGTGVVHTAGMYGEADYDACREHNLPLVHIVGQDGKFLDSVPEFLRGKYVKDAESYIKEDLRKRHRLFKAEKITHSYPFCWRCHTPLLYYAVDSWFIKVTSVKDRMMRLNKKIKWEPEHIRDGRFGKWLENIKDWALSRFKFWGTPLPIWRCECGEEKIIGSVKELKESSTSKFKKYDLHRPWIDTIRLKCKCGKEMMRIPDLIDVWYDSGAATFAQLHYPFENKKEFERRFPYDFISEAIDQTRGWFYTLHAISTMLFSDVAFKNVICAGHIVDERGEKMSKSKSNVIKPVDIISRTGVDAVRLQFCTSEAGNQKRFSYDLMKESVLPFLTILYNLNKYYKQLENKKVSIKIEDRWILSKLNTLIGEVTKELEDYKLSEPFQKISNFVVNDFSRAYIQITREREDTKEIVGEILERVSLLLAPFAPYISEYVYRNFSKESVHLSEWPKADKKKIDDKLEKEFWTSLKIIEMGLAGRDNAGIGLKWPLAKTIIYYHKEAGKELEKIIMEQLNVKKIEWKKVPENEQRVEFDTQMTPELEAEGYAREISRKIQAARKKAGFVKSEKVKIGVVMKPELKEALKKHANFIKERTNAKELAFLSDSEMRKSDYKHDFEEKIKDRKIYILLK